VVTARDAERGDHVEAEHRLQSLVGLAGGERLEVTPLDAFQSRAWRARCSGSRANSSRPWRSAAAGIRPSPCKPSATGSSAAS
jgi:hypothetical protein